MARKKKPGLMQTLLDAYVESASTKKADDIRRRNQDLLAKSRFRSASSVESLFALTPSEFEETIAAILRAGGAVAEVAGGSGDLAADIIGTTRSGVPFIAQCKRYAPGRSVGSVEMQQFIGMGYVHHKVSSLAYFTTGNYTGPAESLAREHGISLYDGLGIVQLAAETLRNRGELRLPPSGWYPDPTGRASSRYWDGHVWTGQIRDVMGSNLAWDPIATRFHEST